jgi:transglutaminase-like putative cysteine protease
MSEDLSLYLQPTAYFDYNQPDVQTYADALTQDLSSSPIEQAIALYKGVRDDILYNPYTFNTTASTLSASHVLTTKTSYCIPKAVLLGAVARYKGIPSRLGLADVKNHLSSPQLIKWLQSDVFVMHGYIELFLEGKWVKATPAFNARLCAMMNVPPLEFDGIHDSLFQDFLEDGTQHMEYLNDYGTFDDVPFDFILTSIANAYPHLKEKLASFSENASLENDLTS